MKFAGIDPSVTCTGIAVLEGKTLIHVSLVRAEDVRGAIARACEVPFADYTAIEYPRVYPTARQKGDPNDLITIALVSGAYARSAHNYELVLPDAWKKQLPKKVVEQRVRERLNTYSLQQLNLALNSMPSSLRHNAIEAVGLALHAAGRSILL